MPRAVGSEAIRSDPAHEARAGYWPYLDGLRAVAVYFVVLFHAGFAWFGGGFIGVDVFFVLSGFLVTRILVRDLASDGRIQWRRFYARRVRRILPAAVVALVCTAVAYSTVASPAEMLDALGGFRAAFFYVANWFFIRQATNYFATNVNTSPVLHFWSLAIEEQFYLLWPLVLGVLYVALGRTGRRRWQVLRALVVVAAVASAAEALRIGSTDLPRAYYGTDTRAYQLLAGAVLALTPELFVLDGRVRRAARHLPELMLAALLVLGTSLIDMSAITRGVLVAALTMALIVTLEIADGGLPKRLLSSRPFAYLGTISYGIYLWHWPVIIVAGHGRHLSSLAVFLIAAPAATALAGLSYHLIEHPIRVSRALDRHLGPVIAAGLATSILVGVLAMPVILNTGSSVSALAPTDAAPSTQRLLNWRVARNDVAPIPDCFHKPVRQCTLVRGRGLRVLLMGDSDAGAWIPTFREIATKRSWTLSVAAYPTCPWQHNLEVVLPTREPCRARQDDWYTRLIPQLNPDLIILAHQAFDDPTRPLTFVTSEQGLTKLGEATFEQTLMAASFRSLGALQRPRRRIVIIEPIPVTPFDLDPINCLSTGGSAARCEYKALRQPTPLERYYQELGHRPAVTTLDLDRLVCPRFPVCDPIVNGIIVKRDITHLTATFARSLADQVGALLKL